jgi:hypothetical protein
VHVVDEDAGGRRRFLLRLRKGNRRRGSGESRRLQERASFQIFLLGG